MMFVPLEGFIYLPSGARGSDEDDVKQEHKEVCIVAQ